MNICQAYVLGYKRNWENILESLCKAVWTDTPLFFLLQLSFYPPHISPCLTSLESVYRAACSATSRKAMDFEVFRQVITAGKLLLADNALVRLYARVGTAMTGELIRPGEPARIGNQDVIQIMLFNLFTCLLWC